MLHALSPPTILIGFMGSHVYFTCLLSSCYVPHTESIERGVSRVSQLTLAVCP